MAEPLSPADRSSLAAEQGPVNMTVGGVLILEDGPGLRHDAILERVGSRLHLIPRYRQKLAQPAPGVTNPVWVDDEGFDLEWHVRFARLSDPGGEAELGRLVGREMSRRLDRDRPLWELLVVEGLAGGRVALVPRMHHALVDGVAAVDIGTVLLDPTPEPLDLPEPDEPWAPRPYDRTKHLARLSVTPALRAQKLLLDSAARALNPEAGWAGRNPVGDLRRATELLTELARTRPSAPMTPLNRPIGPNRRYALASVALADVKAAGRAHGGTVNDVLVALVAGTLRRVLPATDRPPVALVPVSVRRPGEEGGNRISTVLVDLPVGEAGLPGRIAAVSASMQAIKDSAAVRAGALLVGASGWAPPLVSSTLARAMGGVRAFNLVVSNIPGPQQPFWLNGQRLLAAHPVVPLNPASQGLSVGILSYDGRVCFGLLADRDLEPSVEDVAAALGAELRELA